MKNIYLILKILQNINYQGLIPKEYFLVYIYHLISQKPEIVVQLKFLIL